MNETARAAAGITVVPVERILKHLPRITRTVYQVQRDGHLVVELHTEANAELVADELALDLVAQGLVGELDAPEAGCRA